MGASQRLQIAQPRNLPQNLLQTPLMPVPTGALSLSLLLTPEQESCDLNGSSCSSSHSFFNSHLCKCH